MKNVISSFLPLSTRLAVFAIGLTFIQPANADSWIPNSPMINGREFHTTTLLQNGKILVVGGLSNAIPTQYASTTELYDPATGTWTASGSLNIARAYHTATLLPNGKVLVAGGLNKNDGFLSSTELYDPASGTWTTNGMMTTARSSHTATLLSNGKVLLAGGINGNNIPLAQTELYDPATGTCTAINNPMTTAHNYHTATMLPNGKVLITGGQDNSRYPSKITELYDPNNETWTATGSLNIERWNHTTTLLPNGKVLVAGGQGFIAPSLSSTELYDPASGKWTRSGDMTTTRMFHTATLLPNGKVLVVAGVGNMFLSSAELYDPASEVWTATSYLTYARISHRATILPNGKVLVAGGFSAGNSCLSDTEVYDPAINPATGTNTVTGAMITRRADHQAILLPNGKVLVAGGMNDISPSFQSAELFSPSNGTWTATGSMRSERDYGSTLTLLPNGNVLATCGFDPAATYYSELYNPTNGTWTGILQPISPDVSPTATLLPNGKVLVAGGYSKGTGITTGSAELYDPRTKTWAVTGDMRTARWGHTATLLTNGKVLVAGGIANHNGTATNTAELYDPASGTWVNTGAMNGAHNYHKATLLPNGKVLLAGGSPSYEDDPTNRVELYDPVSGTWSYTGAMNVARAGHSATLLPSGKVMVAGGGTNSLAVPGLYDSLASVELYDPATGTWVLTTGLNIPRFAHTATLLPNGKVLIAGGFNLHFSYPTDYISIAELYDAGLGYSNAWQPRITAVTSPLNLGGSLMVTGAQFRGISEGSSGNTQDSATDYPLVQLRSLESGQTTFLLTTNWSTNSVTSSAVWNFPPGWALATVFVNGIQSTSSIVNISVPVPAMSNVFCAATMTGGAFQISFTNSPGGLFGVLATTDLSLPLTNWTALGGVMEVRPGQFQFTDLQPTNGGQRFYRLYAP